MMTKTTDNTLKINGAIIGNKVIEIIIYNNRKIDNKPDENNIKNQVN